VKDALGAVQTALVFGGTSDLAVAIVRRLAQDRLRSVVLAVRDPAAAEPLAEALRGEGLEVHLIAFDARQPADHSAVVESAAGLIGDLDLVLVAFATLSDQAQLEADPARAADVVAVNFGAVASCSLSAVTRLKEQGHGTLLLLSSVAAERVRAGHYVYGATKAGMDGFGQGLGDALHGTGVRVVIVRPGFVPTKMTAGAEPAPFATTSEAVADEVAKGLARGVDVIWAPPILRYVFSALRHLPRPLWRRVSAR